MCGDSWKVEFAVKRMLALGRWQIPIYVSVYAIAKTVIGPALQAVTKNSNMEYFWQV